MNYKSIKNELKNLLTEVKGDEHITLIIEHSLKVVSHTEQFVKKVWSLPMDADLAVKVSEKINFAELVAQNERDHAVACYFKWVDMKKVA